MANYDEATIQKITNLNPELGNKIMDILGYNNSPNPQVPPRVAEINRQIANSPITSDSLSSTPAINLPTVNTPTTSSGALADILSQGKSATQLAQDQYQNELKAYETQAKEKAVGQEGKVRGIFDRILGVQGEKIKAEEAAGIPKLNTEIAEINNRIDAAEAARIAELTALETANMTSSGKASATADINRKYAIQQLSEGVMLSAKTRNFSALQGNIDRKIALELEPLKMQYEFESKFLDNNRDILTKAEERIFQSKADATKRLLDNADKTLTSIGDFAKTVATNGADADTISRVVNSKTMAEAVQNAGRFAGDPLDRQYKQMQIAKLNADMAKVVSETVSTTVPTAKQETEALSTVNSINNIMTDPAFSKTFGLQNILSRNIAGNASYALNAQINNLINKLALAARGQLKGQGAVSDFEGRMLKEAQTALTLNMSPEQATKELAKVRGALLTTSGLEAPVKIISPSGEVKYGKATSDIITNAVASGYQVEYQ